MSTPQCEQRFLAFASPRDLAHSACQSDGRERVKRKWSSGRCSAFNVCVFPSASAKPSLRGLAALPPPRAYSRNRSTPHRAPPPGKASTNACTPGGIFSRRTISLALAVGLLGAGVGIGVASAKKPDCRATIAGTYYKSAGSIFNLSADGTITGNLSETSQVGAGQGDTFLGMWRCDGTTMTGHDFRWVDSDPRKLSRVDWEGTFTPDDGGTLTIHYEFARVPETAAADEVRDAPILFDDDIVAIRIATP